VEWLKQQHSAYDKTIGPNEEDKTRQRFAVNQIKFHRAETRSINKGYVLRPVYTWRTVTGVKLNNNWTQYSSPEFFWQCNQDTEPELH